MAYLDGENLIATLVKAHANFSAVNVEQADWDILNEGGSDHYAIIKPGDTDIEWISVGKVSVHTHQTVIQVWQQYENDGSTAESLYGYVDNILTQLKNNQKLGDTAGIVQNARVISLREVEEMWRKGGGVEWLKRDIVVEWHEQVTAT